MNRVNKFLEDKFDVDNEAEYDKECFKSLQKTNVRMVKLWLMVTYASCLVQIFISLYKIHFVDGFNVKINYIYFILYFVMIIVETLFYRIFKKNTSYSKSIQILDAFLNITLVLILSISIIDFYETESAIIFIGEMVKLSILYIQPKKFNVLFSIYSIIFCVIICLAPNVNYVIKLSTVFYLISLMPAVMLFNLVKYSSKLSELQNVTLLKNLSSVDALTGLRNRLTLSNFLEECKTSDKKYIASMLDIDNFKSVNDTYGHMFGDKVIKFIGGELSNLPGVSYRYGGEEFLVVFEGFNRSEVITVMQKYRKKIEKSAIDGVNFTVSIGVSDEYESKLMEKAIDEADTRLYKVKQSGKNNVM